MFDPRRQLRLMPLLPALLCSVLGAFLITACGNDSGSDSGSTKAPEVTETSPASTQPFALSDLSDVVTPFRIERGVTPAGAPYGGTVGLEQESPGTVIHAGWQTEPSLDGFAAWGGPGLPCLHEGENRLCVARSPVDLTDLRAPVGIVVYTLQEDAGLQASWYRSKLLEDDRPGGGSAVRDGDGAGFAGTYCITYTHADGTTFPSMQLVINQADSSPNHTQFALEWWTVEPHEHVCGERTSNAPALVGVGMQLDDRHMASAWGDIDQQMHILAYRLDDGLMAEWEGKDEDGLGTEQLIPGRIPYTDSDAD